LRGARTGKKQPHHAQTRNLVGGVSSRRTFRQSALFRSQINGFHRIFQCVCDRKC